MSPPFRGFHWWKWVKIPSARREQAPCGILVQRVNRSEPVRLTRQNSRISFEGSLHRVDLRAPLAVFHKAVNQAGYQEITLDFRFCTAAFPASMLALCAQVLRLRHEGISFELVLPDKPELARLFHNASWTHLLDPGRYSPSEFRGHTQIPATVFATAKEQKETVDLIVTAILGAIPGLDRGDFSALEWSVNEVTDNVLVHSQSTSGGIVQVSTFKTRKFGRLLSPSRKCCPSPLSRGWG